MSETMTTGGAVGLAGSDDTRTLFAQTMEYVAATVGLFALGAYLGKSLPYGSGWVFFLASFACLIGMRFAVRREGSSAVGLLLGFGFLIGLATAPTVAYYASTSPEVVWQAGGATALFMAGLGAVGFGSRRDLSAVARVCSWALVVLIVFGIVTIFASVPNESLIYAIAGLVIFAGLTTYDFQRLRIRGNSDSAPLMAASIFLDALNVFLFFLNLFDRRS